MKKLEYCILTFVAGIACLISAKAHASYYENNCCNPCEPFCSSNRYYIEADYLYWKAKVDDMPFAWGAFSSDEGTVKDVSWRFSSGFRVGGGVLLGCNDWDLSLVYTWYRNRSTASFSDPLTDSASNFSSFGLGNATGDRTLRFQTLDLSLRKDFCLCNGFMLAPKMGLLGAHIKDNYFMTFSSVILLNTSSHSQKFWAVGPKIGLESTVDLFCNLSFVAEASLSLLWSDYEIRRNDNYPTVTDFNFNAKQRFDSLRFVPQYLIGFQWESGICCDKYHLRFLAAFEAQQWIHYNQMLNGNPNGGVTVFNTNSDLNLYGLTLRSQLLF